MIKMLIKTICKHLSGKIDYHLHEGMYPEEFSAESKGFRHIFPKTYYVTRQKKRWMFSKNIEQHGTE